MKEKLEVLKEMKDRYGFSKTDTKWLMEGSSIMEYIGIELLIIEFSRDPEKGEWTNVLKKGKILGMGDFNPIDSTYVCKYRTDDMEEDKWKEVRIIPEGFEVIGPDSNKMVRFIPYSLHTKMIETEEFYNKLFYLQVKAKNLDIKELKQISDSKTQDQILEYSHNIGAVIKTEDNNILWFRIKKLEIRHLHGTIYNIAITAWDNRRYVLNEVDSSNDEYSFVVEHHNIGSIKIIDLAR